MSGWLCDLSKLDPADPNLKKVSDLYVANGFPQNFRLRMNEVIMKMEKWPTMGQSQRVLMFKLRVKSVYENSADDEDHKFLTKVMENTSHFVTRFDKCTNGELSLKIKPKRRGTGATASNATVNSTAGQTLRATNATLTDAVANGHVNGVSNAATVMKTEAASAMSLLSRPQNNTSAGISGGSSFRDLFESVAGSFRALENCAPTEQLNHMKRVYNLLEQTLGPIRSAIECWKRLQQRFANVFEDGEVKVENRNEETDEIAENEVEEYYSKLEHICCEAQRVSTYWYMLFDRVHGAFISSNDTSYEELRKSILNQIIALARACFIVIRQPDQVLKKENKFSVTVSLIAGWRSKAPLQSPHVTVEIYKDSELANLHGSDLPKTDSKMMVNPEAAILQVPGASEEPMVVRGKGTTTKRRAQTADKKEVDKKRSLAATKLPQACHAEFDGVSWSSTDSERRNAPSTVTDMKYALVFKTRLTIQVANFHFSENLYCVSLPITCVVHVNQESRARGTIMWDNAFSPYQTSGSCYTCCKFVRGLFDDSSVNSVSGMHDCAFSQSISYATSAMHSNIDFSCSNASQVTLLQSPPTATPTASGFQSVDSSSLFGDGNDTGGIHYCRKPFDVPECVGWNVFKRELNRWFKASVHKGLKDEHLDFIRKCVVQPMTSEASNTAAPVAPSVYASGNPAGSNSSTGPQPPERVYRTRVLIETPSDQPIHGTSYWSWQSGVKKLILDRVDPLINFLWKKDLIHFVTHDQASALLKENFPNPEELAEAMLFRFCNSDQSKPPKTTPCRGAIVVSQGFFTIETTTAPVDVRSIEPWTADHLKKMDLEHRLASEKLSREFVYSVSGTCEKWDSILEEFRNSKNNDDDSSTSKGRSNQSTGNTQYVPTDNECLPNDPREDRDAFSRRRHNTSSAQSNTNTPIDSSVRSNSTYDDGSEPSPASTDHTTVGTYPTVFEVADTQNTFDQTGFNPVVGNYQLNDLVTPGQVPLHMIDNDGVSYTTLQYPPSYAVPILVSPDGQQYMQMIEAQSIYQQPIQAATTGDTQIDTFLEDLDFDALMTNTGSGSDTFSNFMNNDLPNNFATSMNFQPSQ